MKMVKVSEFPTWLPYISLDRPETGWIVQTKIISITAHGPDLSSKCIWWFMIIAMVKMYNLLNAIVVHGCSSHD